jgi:CDP-glucose 4,6-dehydratase
MGTVNLLEAVRCCASARAVVVVTTDKCYENREWEWGYRECEPMGGHDPYSNSKGCAELVTDAYRRSFFAGTRTAVGSARAGNVIGGGDWANDRLIPDILKAFAAGKPAVVRNPDAIRPWQHVLEPLSGYLLLAQTLYQRGDEAARAWNFGPFDEGARPVNWIAEQMSHMWGEGARWQLMDGGDQPHEATYLKLDISRARTYLDWSPTWTLQETLRRIVDWQRGWLAGDDCRQLCLDEIAAFTGR